MQYLQNQWLSESTLNVIVSELRESNSVLIKIMVINWFMEALLYLFSWK
jgi:hypothetical protein